jgi:hypothetical protein
MDGIRWARALSVGAVALLAAACGGGDGGSDEDADDGDREEVTTVGLDEAFSAAADATSYTIEQSTGQTIDSDILGHTSSVIDEENPSVVGEVTPEATHLTVDLTSILGPMLGDAVEDIGFEIWTDAERMVVDSRDYAAVKEANPDADLGPYEPGVSYVDLAKVGEEAPDLVSTMVGQSGVDLVQLAEELPKTLEDVEQDGTTITGTASYADLLTALGADVEQNARGVAGGLALNLDIDPDALTDYYVDFYEATEADVTVELGDDDLVESIHYEVDLSDIFSSMVSDADPLGLEIPADEVDEARALFEDTEWTLESLIKFDVVDDLTVEPAPATTDDRTDEWLAFLEANGF